MGCGTQLLCSSPKRWGCLISLGSTEVLALGKQPAMGYPTEGSERGGHPRDSLQGRPRYRVSRSCFFQSGAACKQAEAEAVHLANEMQAEYWSVSAKTGE